MKKKAGIVILAVLFVALICGSFYYVKIKSNATPDEDTHLTKIQKITTRDLEKNYPKTPRAVVKLYNQIITSYYEKEYTDEEFGTLVDQAMLLFDDELAKNNPKETYIQSLKKEIADYDKRSRQIRQTNVCDSDDVL